MKTTTVTNHWNDRQAGRYDKRRPLVLPWTTHQGPNRAQRRAAGSYDRHTALRSERGLRFEDSSNVPVDAALWAVTV